MMPVLAPSVRLEFCTDEIPPCSVSGRLPPVRPLIPKGTWDFIGKRVYEVAGTPQETTRRPTMDDDTRTLITAALKAEKIPPTEENITARFKLKYGIK